ncbi:hypothetical protein D3C78_1868750 [compost metagenome]
MIALQGVKNVSRNRMKYLNELRNEYWPSSARVVDAATITSTNTMRWPALISRRRRKPLMMVATHMKLP